MPARRILPPDDVLLALVSEGLTQQEIADRLTQETGRKVTRSAVSVALHRAGATKEAPPRYRDTLPWRVRSEHLGAYPARMLRSLGRRRAGLAMKADDERRLDGWLTDVSYEDVVVAYSPKAGFLYVPRDERDDGQDGIPIRPRLIHDDELPE